MRTKFYLLFPVILLLAIPAAFAQEMDREALTEKTYSKFFGERTAIIYETDPEFMDILDKFIFGEVYHQNGSLTERQRELINLVVFTVNQNQQEIAAHTKVALRIGVSPVEIKEAVYQCAPYAGFSKVLEALSCINRTFLESGIKLPLDSQQTVAEKARYEEGLKIQVRFFGEKMKQVRENAPEGQKHVQEYLSAMCFGDFYTRNGLDLQTRELLTFCMVCALGGCESQVRAHVQGNLNAGNDKETLVAALTQCLPYIGFPRMLNALACVNETAK